MDKRTEELIERGVAALEKLASEEIEFQVQTKPPVCPHCNYINPNIRVEEATGSGPMVEHFTQAHCLHCHKVFWIIPLQYESVKSQMDARAVIEEKIQLGGYERNGQEH